MNKLLAFLLVAAATVGVAYCKVPPLATLPESLNDLEEEAFLEKPTHYAFNFGLTGTVTQEDWDRATLFNADAPAIDHPNLNGNPDPVIITGKKMVTIKNREINAFQGIRYAEPPVGNMRFKKPEPAKPYFGPDNILDATHLGEKCPQKAMFGHVGAGSEDCLSLNVYTPYLPDELPGGKLLPVMMFIHGGAFVSGDSSLYMPTKLLDQDVILVVIHYRLGSLGFFSLQNDQAPGNAGLWDQIAAMQWIQDNIEPFGGDPGRLTIFGESAGSASVNYHLVLPKSNALFHGVIGESGSALEHWSLDPEPMISARLIAGRNGCPNDTIVTEQDIFDCMIKVPHEELSLNMANFVSEDRQSGEMGFRGTAPVLEGPGVSEAVRLVAKYPKQYFEDGEASDVPLMIGANKHEGSFVLGIMYTSYLDPNGYVIDTNYVQNQMMADLLNAFGVRDQTNGISESLVDAYVQGPLTDFDSATPGMIDLAGVLFLKAGAWQTAKMHAKHLTTNAYVYSFDFESDDSMFTWLFIGHDEIPFRPGVTHADELMYLFSLPAVLEGHQLVVKDRLVALWTNFAKYGDPTPDADRPSWESLNIPKWLPVKSDDHHFMLIQEECTLMNEYPDRWYITLEESQVPGTTVPTAPTEETTKGPTQEQYDQIEHERQAFMISMIMFIVATALLGGVCIFLFIKK